ncbi:MAG: right-handed parallel beta-helix repeat-containing protein [Candidatus Pacearchaeota archaeon]|jgi:cysteine-rich repeat protein/parallel beta-helix repeat protein
MKKRVRKKKQLLTVTILLIILIILAVILLVKSISNTGMAGLTVTCTDINETSSQDIPSFVLQNYPAAKYFNPYVQSMAKQNPYGSYYQDRCLIDVKNQTTGVWKSTQVATCSKSDEDGVAKRFCRLQEGFCSGTSVVNYYLVCNTSCKNGACLRNLCGNGIVEPSEECDDGNLINGDGCSNTCTSERINFTCGQNLYSNLFLEKDLISTWDTCISVFASNIIINCNGHNITSLGGSGGVYIDVGKENISIVNCTFLNFATGTGIKSFNVDNRNLNVKSCKFINNRWGINAGGGKNITLSDCIFKNNSYAITNLGVNSTVINNVINQSYNGIILDTSKNTLIKNNTITACYEGIIIDHSNDLIITNNRITNNSVAFSLIDSSNNILGNNTILNNSIILQPRYGDISDYTLLNNQLSSNYFGTTDCRIIKSKLLPHSLNIEPFLNKPWPTGTLINCVWPKPICGDIIYVDTNLESNLLASDLTCLTIAVNGVVLDCKGHNITGNNKNIGISVGATTYPVSNVTIKNCIISNFEKNIRLEDSDYTKILNNILSNALNGMEILYSDHIIIRNNTIQKSSGINTNGIYLDGDTDTLVIENKIMNNSYVAVRLRYVNNLLFQNNSFYNSGYKNLVNNNGNQINVLSNYWGSNNCGIITSKLMGITNFNPILNAPWPQGQPINCI